jgi:hypothetical protein
VQLVRRRIRRPLAELNRVRGVLLAVAAAFTLIAATPEPLPTRVDLTKLQPKALLPKTKLHSEFVVEVNKLGQVTRVRSMKSSGDATFNTQTFGNAEQAFIRKPDGTVVVGSYRMIYDYNPATGRVHREAELVQRGGVDPNAKGAVIQMEEIARKHAAESPSAAEPHGALPNPQATIRTDKRLPDLPLIIHSPGH